MKRVKKNMKIEKSSNNIIWYILASFIPMIFNFIRTPIFTRYFTTTEYGNISIVNTTYSYISMICFTWITASIWRYYYKYKSENIDVLKSNINFLIIAAIMLNIIISLIWMSIEKNYNLKLVILIAMINNIILQTLNTYLIFTRLEGKAKTFSFVNIAISIGSFMILIYLTFIMKMKIEAFFLSALSIDLFVFILFLIFNKHLLVLNIKFINKDVIRDIFYYGVFSSLISLNLLILTSSDKYVIKFLDGIDKVGIYNQIYIISEYSIISFSTIFFNIINPVLLKSYEDNNEESISIQWKLISLYLAIILPLSIYFSLYAKQISLLLLGDEFQIGYKIMPFVMVTAFIYGLSQFYSSKFKYIGKMNTVLKGMCISSIFNIVSNILLVPYLGYKVAALTTFISYLIMFFYFYFNEDKKYLSNKLNRKIILDIIKIILIQLIVHIIITCISGEISILIAIIEGAIFVATIYFYMYRKYKQHIIKLR